LATKTVWIKGPNLNPLPVKYTLQRVKPGLGNVEGSADRSIQLRAHVIPADPRTPAQIACREKFAAAMAEYSAMTAEQKQYWKEIGNKSAISAMNAYTRHKIKT